MTTPTTEVAEPPAAESIPIVPLTLRDRCDRCGAQAFARTAILTPNGAVDMLWCGHHFRQHGEKLTAVSLSIQDETSRINEKPTSSAA
jgi:hypothetical protein